jgi:hypothetical protein
MTGSDRQQLAAMSGKAKAAMGVEALDVLADRGYFSGEEIVACEAIGVTPYVPKPLTSGAKADGRACSAHSDLPATSKLDSKVDPVTPRFDERT